MSPVARRERLMLPFCSQEWQRSVPVQPTWPSSGGTSPGLNAGIGFETHTFLLILWKTAE